MSRPRQRRHRVRVRAIPDLPGLGRMWTARLYIAGIPDRVVLCATHARAIESAGDLLREAAAEAAGLTYVRLP